jgi:hypothetical protein
LLRLIGYGLVALITILLQGCDPSGGRPLGFSMSEGGDILVRYNPCGRNPGNITDVRLLRVKGYASGDEDDEVFWHIKSVSQNSFVQLVIGGVPSGFELVVPFSTKPDDQLRIVLFVDREGTYDAYAGFRIRDLRPNLWLTEGEYVTTSNFDSLDTCN